MERKNVIKIIFIFLPFIFIFFSILMFFELPFRQSSTIKKILPNIFLFSTLYKNSVLDKSIIENICKSAIVLSTYPIELNKKVAIDKYEGILKDYNFWYITLHKKNSVIYLPTFKMYNSVYEVFN
jgi:hypothetical protein